MLRRLAPLVVLASSLVVPMHAAGEPRAIVQRVADAIEQYYFDPQRAREIADSLRADASHGEFDAFDTQRAVADALTTRLNAVDRHFRLREVSPGEAAPTAASPSPRIAPAGPGPRPMPRTPMPANFGIDRLEELPDGTGYLRLDQFVDIGADDAARRAVDAALGRLLACDAVIVDLRDSRGGSPALVGYLVSAFTARDADIYNTFHTRRGSHSEAPREHYDQPDLDVPLYILTNGVTRSAAEAFTYTLKNAGRATVVGAVSAGAANPGSEIDVGDGLVVFVPQGTPKSPITHTNWEGVGIRPDHEVPAERALDAAQALIAAARTH